METKMKLAIVGSRNWQMPIIIANVLQAIYANGTLEEIVTGGAKGVDEYAESWAKLNAVPCKVFKPDWSVGKKGGAIRNKKIVDYCDELIAFWDGKSKGTLISIEMAKKAGKLARVYNE